MLKQIMKLAVKDFEIQKKSILNYMIIGILMVVAFSLVNLIDRQMVFSLVLFAIVYGFVNKALYEDEKNNTLRLFASLPVKKEVIVYARYLSVGIILIFTTCLFLALGNVISGGNAANESSGASILISIATMFVFVIMLSVYLPVAFKLGYIKAAGINRFLFIGIFAFFGAGSAAVAGLFKGKSAEYVNNLDAFLSSLNLNTVLAIIIVAALLVYLGSMRLSAAFFRKRDVF